MDNHGKGQGGQVKVARMDPGEARKLIDELDDYHRARYPDESNHLEPVEALRADNVVFVGAWLDGELVGTGAVRYMNDGCDYAEIKRVYVRPEARRRGLSRAIMEYLENDAASRGVSVLRLETGVHQPAAIQLYETLGYHHRNHFGDYTDDPLSVFMEKVLIA